MSNYIKIGIDASRNRSGGAKAHLIGILSECNRDKYRIQEIHVWAFRSLLDELPDCPWLIKHNPIALEQSLLKQLLWQATELSAEVQSAGCDILFTTDASTLCHFSPMVVLSQDLLSYEPGMMRYYGFNFASLRLLVILGLQNLAFRRAQGVIFLTQYAGKIIQESCGLLRNIAYIPHGVDLSFNSSQVKNPWPVSGERTIFCTYVSNAEMYKYQWVVAEAIAILRARGYDLSLKLIGGGKGPAQELLESVVARLDSDGKFIQKLNFLPKNELIEHLAKSDLFIFASGCESFGITLLEGMSIGLPIACSRRSSLPETLQDGGVYFDPENVNSIVETIELIVRNPQLRVAIAQRAKKLSQRYSWKRCADETFAFITETHIRAK
jgi:glycosyltransferase involved in cell wall biosynthesis